MTALLEARGLRKEYRSRAGGAEVAVAAVDLALAAGERLALVGESGSGKTTLVRLLARLVEPTRGEIRFRGEDWLALRGAELRRRRRHLQLVFQDPYLSLDPRFRVGAAIAEPARVHGLAGGDGGRALAARLLGEVGLAPELTDRFPHQLSGGQRQRVAIARALASEPSLLLADEPVSALDAPLRARVMGLLLGLARDRNLALLLVAHDLGLALPSADRVAVLLKGQVVEEAPARELAARPRHPYSAALLAAAGLGAGPAPAAGGAAARAGDDARQRGCPFAARCRFVRPVCRSEMPALRPAGPGRVACHLAEELPPLLDGPPWNLSAQATY